MVQSVGKAEKRRRIVDCALAIMRDHGNQRLTMRYLAGEVSMSLSNVQYYFANRSLLLRAMIDCYFAQCTEMLRQQFEQSHDKPHSQRIRKLLELGLSHGQALTDLCKIFREFWALATRDAEVNRLLIHYYHNFCDEIREYFCDITCSPQQIDRVITLLVPYFEGYSIVATAMPASHEDMIDYLTGIVQDTLLKANGS